MAGSRKEAAQKAFDSMPTSAKRVFSGLAATNPLLGFGLKGLVGDNASGSSGDVSRRSKEERIAMASSVKKGFSRGGEVSKGDGCAIRGRTKGVLK